MTDVPEPPLGDQNARRDTGTLPDGRAHADARTTSDPGKWCGRAVRATVRAHRAVPTRDGVAASGVTVTYGTNRVKALRCRRVIPEARAVVSPLYGRRRVLRSRQDDHRQELGARVRQALLPRGPALASGRSSRACTRRSSTCSSAPTSRRWRRSARRCCRSPRAGSRTTSRRSCAETLDEVISPIVFAEALELFDEHHARRAATSSSCRRRRPRWSTPLGDVPRCRRGDRDPGRASTTTATTPASSSSTRTASTRPTR